MEEGCGRLTCSIIRLVDSAKRCLHKGHACLSEKRHELQTKCPFRHWCSGGTMKLWHPEQQKSLSRSSYSTRLRTSSGVVGVVLPLGMTRGWPLEPEPPLILGFEVSLREKEEPILLRREDLTSASEVTCTPGMSSQHSSGCGGGVRLGVLNSRRKLREMTEPRVKFGGAALVSKVGAEVLWAGVVDSCGTLPLRLLPSERLPLAADAGTSNSCPLKETLRDMFTANGMGIRPSLSDACRRWPLPSTELASSLRGSIWGCGRMGLLSQLLEPFSEDWWCGVATGVAKLASLTAKW